jgi:hypothetical protein
MTSIILNVSYPAKTCEGEGALLQDYCGYKRSLLDPGFLSPCLSDLIHRYQY